MVFNLKQVALASALIVSGLPLLAEDIALVIGNSNYRQQPRTPEAVQVNSAKASLEAAGFRVLYGQDLSRVEQYRIAKNFMLSAKDAEHIVVVISGQIVSSKRDSWLLAVDGRVADVFSIGVEGLSLGALMDVLSQKPGSSVMVIGENSADIRIGDWLEAQAEGVTIPQGVMLLRGPTREAMRFLERSVLIPDQVIRNAPENIEVSGFVSQTVPFLSESQPAIFGSVDPNDRAYWEAVKSVGTIEALLTYIDRYPDGNYVQDANRAIGELRANPERQAQEAEKALGLGREQRRQIQRNLSILGFNPRGVDGVFGRGSRAAIGAWQRSRGIEGTGYLSGNQISALQSSADIRAQELEEEARRRQEEQDRLDAVYWRRTGRDGTEPSLRAYLKRYPDGIYAEIAQGQIDRFEEDRRAQAAAVERDYWDQIQANGTAPAYRQYLKKYPHGAFAPTAKERLAALDGSSRDDEMLRRARADEARVAGTGIARLLIEQKLQSLGLKPGRVDGKFDDKSRRAIRKFQRARQIPVSGYVTQQTVVQLLATR